MQPPEVIVLPVDSRRLPGWPESRGIALELQQQRGASASSAIGRPTPWASAARTMTWPPAMICCRSEPPPGAHGAAAYTPWPKA
jgi:hypothetical protein